jgi:GTPase SAR1 family protein
MMLGEDVKIKFYDLGGGPKIRDIWEQYYHDVHGFIYVIDAAANAEQLKESVSAFEKLRSHTLLEGKPGLILANKQDMANALPANELAKALSIDSSKMDTVVVKECTCTPSGGNENTEASANANPEGEEVSVDPRLEDAMVWLLETVRRDYDHLNAKVVADTAQKDALEAAKRAQRERNVLRNKIACAFMDQIDQTVKDVNIATANPNDLYGEVDGLAYLSGETGVDVANLDPIALDVARLVGYQRLALQMVGAMSAPVNKKKDPMPWSQIRDLVLELRRELGLRDS